VRRLKELEIASLTFAISEHLTFHEQTWSEGILFISTRVYKFISFAPASRYKFYLARPAAQKTPPQTNKFTTSSLQRLQNYF